VSGTYADVGFGNGDYDNASVSGSHNTIDFAEGAHDSATITGHDNTVSFNSLSIDHPEDEESSQYYTYTGSDNASATISGYNNVVNMGNGDNDQALVTGKGNIVNFGMGAGDTATVTGSSTLITFDHGSNGEGPISSGGTDVVVDSIAGVPNITFFSQDLIDSAVIQVQGLIAGDQIVFTGNHLTGISSATTSGSDLKEWVASLSLSSHTAEYFVEAGNTYIVAEGSHTWQLQVVELIGIGTPTLSVGTSGPTDGHVVVA